MRKSKLTSEEVMGIIDMRNKGFRVNYVADKYNTNTGTISRVHRAYNGNLKIYNSLGDELKAIIDECKNSVPIAINTPQRYEVKILFGLITLKINPIV